MLGTQKLMLKCSDVLFRHSQTHSSTEDNGQNEYRPERRSSDAIGIGDDNEASQDHQKISVALTRRQPSISPSPAVPEAQERNFTASSQHASPAPSSAMPTPPTETPIDDTPRPQKRQRFSPQFRQTVDASQGSSMGQSPFTISQTLPSQLDVDQVSTFIGIEFDQQRSLGSFDDLDMFSFETGQMPIFDNAQFSFDAMDGSDLNSSIFPFSTPAIEAISCSQRPRSGGLMTISAGQMQKVQRIWSRQRPKVLTQINSLWSDVIKHNVDNILTAPQQRVNLDSHQSLGCNVDQACRDRLIQYCKDLDGSFGSSSTTADEIYMPSIDLLDSSLDFYFQFFHPVLPFIHKSTFNAGDTPSPLLLAMCLVGLSYLDRTQTKAFLTKYLRACYLPSQIRRRIANCVLEVAASLSPRLDVSNTPQACTVRLPHYTCHCTHHSLLGLGLSCT
jgi:hypothetical protein